MKQTPKVICVAGATGSGKSAIAAQLGRDTGGVVINMDSRQVYADFPIITAQPGESETALCPHLLYGFLPSTQSISAGSYTVKVSELIKKVITEGKQPILVGGTGLYFKALMHGIANIPQIPKDIHDKWQQECATLGSIALHATLQQQDPEYAAKIHPHDRQRITRALEVYDFTGKTFSMWHATSRSSVPFNFVYLGLDISLKELEPGLYKRIDIMLANGAIDEAKAALQNCADSKSPGWSGIGCAELYKYLHGNLSLEEAKELWYKNTRAYAKRQLTWFRGQPDIVWYKPCNYENFLKAVKN
ncbi:tRNA (adenosine(37)-N6)-dimethylallyltransferase MiaA [Desulfovibrio sp. OttesenSCG-928-F07]|nr:tRNA (adenosine(37)-N6)-dimethylallyltransferase MiaA [Desulfovibrio sp. OttesenSCG-928-F07]